MLLFCRNLFCISFQLLIFALRALATSEGSCWIAGDILKTSCFACRPEFYSLYEASNFEVLFPTSSCLQKKSEGKLLDLFVQGTECLKEEACDGTMLSPFDNLVKALEHAHINSKEYLSCSINIYLKGPIHYITQANLDNSSIKHFFRKNNASIRIVPIEYYNTGEEALKLINMPSLILKTNEFKIFISGNLEIAGIIFIGSDLVLLQKLKDKRSCLFLQKICCDSADLSENFDENSDSSCGVGNFENFKPTDGPFWGLFNMDSIFNSEEKNSSLTMRNLKFINLILANNKYNMVGEAALSLIAVSQTFPIQLSISNVSVINSFFTVGMISLNNFYSFIDDSKILQDEITEIKIKLLTIFGYNTYGIISLEPYGDGLINLRKFKGKATFESFFFIEYKGPTKFFKVFDLSYTTNQIFIDTIIVKDSFSHTFLECNSCHSIEIKNLYLTNLSEIITDSKQPYIKLYADAISLENINLKAVEFNNENEDGYTFQIESKQDTTEISTIIIEQVIGWSIVLIKGANSLSNIIILDSIFSQNIIFFKACSVNINIMIFNNINIINNRVIEIHTQERTDQETDKKIINFNKLVAANYLVGEELDYSSFILWSSSGETDEIQMNNTVFENATTMGIVNDHGFFSAPFVYHLEFYNTQIINFEDGCPPMFITISDFKYLIFENLTYDNIHNNRYYIFSVEGLGELFIYNMVVSNTGLNFDTYFIDVTFLTMENVILTNIYSATRAIWYIFKLQNAEILKIKNFTFKSSLYSEFDPTDYDSPFGTNIIYFLTCNNIYFETGDFEISKTNTIMNELFLFASKLNEFFLLKDLRIINFNSLHGYSGNLMYENGVISFISSSSYIIGSEISSTVILNGITLQESYYNRNGALGFLNIEKVIIQNITSKDTRSLSGGVFSFIYCVNVLIDNLITLFTEAIYSGGVIFSRGTSKVVLKNSSITETRSSIGGAFYFRETQIGISIENVQVEQSYSLKEAGCLYLLMSDCEIVGGLFVKILSDKEGGGIYQKGKNLQVSKNFACYSCISLFGGFLYVDNAYHLNLDQLNIVNTGAYSKGGFLLIYDTKKIEFFNLLLDYVFLQEGSGVIYIENEIEGLYRIENITLKRSRALDNAFLSFSSSSTLIIDNLTLIENEGSLMSFISPLANEYQYIYIQNIKVIGYSLFNDVAIADYLFKYQGIQNLTLTEGFFKNLMFKNSVLNVINTFAAFNKLSFESGLNFTAFQEYLYLFYFENSNCLITSSSFVGIKEQNIGCLYSKDSNLSISRLMVERCDTLAPACLNIQTSQIILFDSTFTSNIGFFSGVIYAKLSSLFIINCKFDNNVFNSSAKMYVVSDNAEFSFSNNIFLECFEQRIVIVKTSFLEKFPGVSVNLKNSRLELISSNFESFTPASRVGSKAIIILNSDLMMTSCAFSNFNSQQGGTIKVDQTDSNNPKLLVITDCLFQNSTSDYGGVFLFSGILSVHLEKNNFFGNSAVKNVNQKLGIGGVGIFLSGLNPGSSFKLFSNTFVNNKADYLFPTVFADIEIVTSKKKETSNENIFLNNEDGLNFTSHLSCFPLKKYFLFENNQGFNKYFKESDILTIVSGTPFNLSITVADHFDQVLVFDNESTAAMLEIPDSSRKYFYFSNKESQSKSGLYGFPSLLIKTDPGKEFQLQLKLNLKFDNLFFYQNQAVQSQATILNFFSRPCEIGEIFIEGDQSCYRCPPGKYSLDDPFLTNTSNLKCSICLNNAVCSGGKSITPNSGFWRSSNVSELIVECVSKISCLGFKAENATEDELIQGSCEENTMGNLCYNCKPGFARFSSRDVCKSCQSEKITYVKFSFIIVGFLTYIVFQVKLTFRMSKSSYAGILLKLMVNHFQQIGMISLVDLGWTPDFKSYFSFQEYFAFISDDLVPTECMVRMFDYDIYAQKVIISNVIPIAISFVLIFVWLMTSFLKTDIHYRKSSEMSPTLLDKIRVSFLIIVTLFFPEVIRKALGILNCIKIDEKEEISVLYFSPEVKCWTIEHAKFILLAALPGIIVWGLFVPLFILYQLRKAKNVIKKIIKSGNPDTLLDIKTSNVIELLGRNSIMNPGKKQKKFKVLKPRDKRQIYPVGLKIGTDNSIHNIQEVIHFERTNRDLGSLNITCNPQFENRNNVQKNNYLKDNHNSRLSIISFKGYENKLQSGILLKFIYKGYRHEYYFWELVMFAKRSLLITIGCITDVFPAPLKAIFLLLLLSFFLLIQAKYQPFERKFLNNIEFFSLVTTFLTADFGIMMFTDSLKSIGFLFLFPLAAVNLGFILYWGHCFWKFVLYDNSIFKRLASRIKKKTG